MGLSETYNHLSHMDVEPAGLSEEQIEARAARLAGEYDFNAARDAVSHLVEQMKGRIRLRQPATPYWVRVVENDEIPGKKFELVVGPSAAMANDNFEIAHALGHVVLHSGTPMFSKSICTTCSHDPARQRVEWEATRFAVYLLMPAEDFKSATKDFKNDVDSLAQFFCVPRKVVELRASIESAAPKVKKIARVRTAARKVETPQTTAQSPSAEERGKPTGAKSAKSSSHA